MRSSSLGEGRWMVRRSHTQTTSSVRGLLGTTKDDLGLEASRTICVQRDLNDVSQIASTRHNNTPGQPESSPPSNRWARAGSRVVKGINWAVRNSVRAGRYSVKRVKRLIKPDAPLEQRRELSYPGNDARGMMRRSSSKLMDRIKESRLYEGLRKRFSGSERMPRNADYLGDMLQGYSERYVHDQPTHARRQALPSSEGSEPRSSLRRSFSRLRQIFSRDSSQDLSEPAERRRSSSNWRQRLSETRFYQGLKRRLSSSDRIGNRSTYPGSLMLYGSDRYGPNTPSRSESGPISPVRSTFNRLKRTFSRSSTKDESLSPTSTTRSFTPTDKSGERRSFLKRLKRRLTSCTSQSGDRDEDSSRLARSRDRNVPQMRPWLEEDPRIRDEIRRRRRRRRRYRRGYGPPTGLPYTDGMLTAGSHGPHQQGFLEKTQADIPKGNIGSTKQDISGAVPSPNPTPGVYLDDYKAEFLVPGQQTKADNAINELHRNALELIQLEQNRRYGHLGPKRRREKKKNLIMDQPMVQEDDANRPSRKRYRDSTHPMLGAPTETHTVHGPKQTGTHLCLWHGPVPAFYPSTLEKFRAVPTPQHSRRYELCITHGKVPRFYSSQLDSIQTAPPEQLFKAKEILDERPVSSQRSGPEKIRGRHDISGGSSDKSEAELTDMPSTLTVNGTAPTLSINFPALKQAEVYFFSGSPNQLQKEGITLEDQVPSGVSLPDKHLQGPLNVIVKAPEENSPKRAADKSDASLPTPDAVEKTPKSTTPSAMEQQTPHPPSYSADLPKEQHKTKVPEKEDKKEDDRITPLSGTLIHSQQPSRINFSVTKMFPPKDTRRTSTNILDNLDIMKERVGKKVSPSKRSAPSSRPRPPFRYKAVNDCWRESATTTKPYDTPKRSSVSKSCTPSTCGKAKKCVRVRHTKHDRNSSPFSSNITHQPFSHPERPLNRTNLRDKQSTKDLYEALRKADVQSITVKFRESPNLSQQITDYMLPDSGACGMASKPKIIVRQEDSQTELNDVSSLVVSEPSFNEGTTRSRISFTKKPLSRDHRTRKKLRRSSQCSSSSEGEDRRSSLTGKPLKRRRKRSFRNEFRGPSEDSVQSDSTIQAVPTASFGRSDEGSRATVRCDCKSSTLSVKDHTGSDVEQSKAITVYDPQVIVKHSISEQSEDSSSYSDLWSALHCYLARKQPCSYAGYCERPRRGNDDLTTICSQVGDDHTTSSKRSRRCRSLTPREYSGAVLCNSPCHIARAPGRARLCSSLKYLASDMDERRRRRLLLKLALTRRLLNGLRS